MPIEILKPGSFTALGGEAVSFTAADLAAAAAAYDPALHEAPIVVGHPQHDLPAYGWVKGLTVEGGKLKADHDQVDPAFAELVRAGRFKKISASFYRPDSPSNPKPGSWYLRHVGVLGAQPPAVKGLKPVQLSAQEAGVVELADGWLWGDVAGLFRGIRDWILGQFGQEAADKAVPGGAIDFLLQQAAREQAKEIPVSSTGTAAMSEPAFAEASADKPANTETENVMSKETQDQAALDARKAELDRKESDLAESEKRIKDREAAARRDDDARFVETLIADGKVLPAQKDGVVAFMSTLAEDGVVSFGEGAAKTEKPSGAFFRELLGGLPKQVDFEERAAAGKKAPTDDPVALAEAIDGEVRKAAAEGRTIDQAEALRRLKKGS